MNTIKAYWFVFSLLVRTALPKIPDKKRADTVIGIILLTGFGLSIIYIVIMAVLMLLGFKELGQFPIVAGVTCIVLMLSSIFLLLVNAARKEDK